MKYLNSGYRGTHDHITIYPIGDLQVGSPQYKEQVLIKQLKQIDQSPDNARIILMGDMIDNNTKMSVGAGVFEQPLTPEQQIYRVVDLLKPYVHLIDGVVTGNHEQRTYLTHGFDPTLLLCKLLNIEDKYLRYQGVIKYAWNNRAYNVAVWHGAGGGGGSSLNKLIKQRNTVMADVYLMGHTHKLEATKLDYFVPDARSLTMQKITQAFIVTGSTLDYEDSYAEEKGLNPSAMGFPKIHLSGYSSAKKREKDIKVEI